MGGGSGFTSTLRDALGRISPTILEPMADRRVFAFNLLDKAVSAVLKEGHRTADIAGGKTSISTSEMGDEVIKQLNNLK